MEFRYKIKRHIYYDDYDVKVEIFNFKTNKWDKFNNASLEEVCEISKDCVYNKLDTEEYDRVHQAMVHGWDQETMVLIIKKFGTVNDFMMAYIKEILRRKNEEEQKKSSYNSAAAYLSYISNNGWAELFISEKN